MPQGPFGLAIQYLEGSAVHARRVSPPEARQRLQAMLQRAPLQRLLLGWNLPEAVVESCAAECQRGGIELYLWQPLLTGDGDFTPPTAWGTIGLSGNAVPGHGGLAEFTFICPNRPAVRAAALEHLEKVLAAGYYQGVFLDRMRYPSPARNAAEELACFCPGCRRAAEQAGIHLGGIQHTLRESLDHMPGRASLARGLLGCPAEGNQAHEALRRLLAFRQASITGMVREAAEIARQKGLKVGLDCFSPGLAAMVGQDLTALSALADWGKVMTYLRALGPATIPFELSGLAGWLVAAGLPEADALAQLAAATGWALPDTLAAMRHGGLDAAILTGEVRRARAEMSGGLLAGIELVEMAGVSELNERQIRADLAAMAAGGADGLVLSWDGWAIPLERLELVGEASCISFPRSAWERRSRRSSV